MFPDAPASCSPFPGMELPVEGQQQRSLQEWGWGWGEGPHATPSIPVPHPLRPPFLLSETVWHPRMSSHPSPFKVLITALVFLFTYFSSQPWEGSPPVAETVWALGLGVVPHPLWSPRLRLML